VEIRSPIAQYPDKRYAVRFSSPTARLRLQIQIQIGSILGAALLYDLSVMDCD
jgi:hypothetical protein